MSEAMRRRERQRWDAWHDAGGRTSLVREARAPRILSIAAEPEPIEIDLAMTALLVIDMQNDFLHPEGWFAETLGVDTAPLRGPVDAINALAAALREHGVPVVHVNWGVRDDVANLPANVIDRSSRCGRVPGYAEAGRHGRALVRGDWGARSLEAVEVAQADLTVHKHRLSGFRDNELDSVLRRLGMTTLLFTGVNLDRCVFATLMDAAFQGFDPILIEDATATPSPAHVAEAITFLVRLLYGFTASSSDLLSALAGLPPTPKGHAI